MKAKELKLTKIEDLDVDSTVKEANITYPTDAKNLKTQMLMISSCLEYFKNNGYHSITSFALEFNISKALSDFKKYFFEKDKEKKTAILKALAKRIKILLENALAAFEKINMARTKWHIMIKIEKIQKYAKVYIKQVEHFCRTGHACKNKILSFHIENVVSIQKGKEHKKYEFGEVWQIGRLDGNFCFGMFSHTDLRYSDSTAMKDILGKIIIKTDHTPGTLTADRAYWSSDNIDAADSVGIIEQGIHPKGKNQWRVTSPDLIEKFINRRSGIEPIIGHLKRLGLGKSRMRTDIGTRVEGARSFIAFNLRRILESFK
jgi:IS5 family transposase